MRLSSLSAGTISDQSAPIFSHSSRKALSRYGAGGSLADIGGKGLFTAELEDALRAGQVQLAVHRLQPMDVTRQAFDWMRDEGYHSISVDLIFGLPHQTADSFARTIDDVLTLRPDRLAVFSYAHVPWIKPSQRIFEKQASLPSTEEKLRMLSTAVRKLTAAGMVYIGMDHFARTDDELAVAQREGLARYLRRRLAVPHD